MNIGTPKAAFCLTLLTRPSSPAANRFIDAVAEAALDWEWQSGPRRNSRGEVSTVNLRLAVGTLCGGLLLNASRGNNPATYSYERTSRDAVKDAEGRPGRNPFKDAKVSWSAFSDVRAALKGAGLVEEVDGGGGHLRDGKPLYRCATRFRATSALWAMAAAHGIACNREVEHHFARPRTAPVACPFEVEEDGYRHPEGVADGTFRPISIRALKAFPAATRKGASLAVPEGPWTDVIRASVEARNRRIAEANITGCDPVTLFRGFNEDYEHGGRWYVVGCSFQGWSGDERHARLRIDGTPVAEVDVCASHLTIMYGLLGLLLPTHPDLYAAVPGTFSRDVVKLYVAQTIGAGRAKAAWSKKALKQAIKGDVSLAGVCVEALKAAVLSAFPFLADYPRCIGNGWMPRLASLRLQNIEAEAVTLAMDALDAQGITSLPMHDSLIVPQGAEKAASLALRSAYQQVAGIIPRVKMKANAN